MSTDEEIREVYEGDIGRQSSRVLRKFGPEAFYSGLKGMRIKETLPAEFEELCAAVNRADNAPAVSTAKRGSR